MMKSQHTGPLCASVQALIRALPAVAVHFHISSTDISHGLQR
jgi:hypothetical protein